MVILEFKGGIGNQMFQYAFYKSLIYHNRHVKCAITNKSEYRQFKLNIFPNVKFDCIDHKPQDRIIYKFKKWKVLNKIISKLTNGLIEFYLFEDEEKEIDERLYVADNIIISGYFQNEKYFKMIKNQIRNDFCFPLGEAKLQDFITGLNENSVSIHIRRGDYLKNPEIYGDICTLNYYYDAIAYMESKINANYIILSDDIEWAKEKFNFLDSVIYVERENFNKYDDWYDMCIMSNCYHNIIANSSFSWWGAWLNNHSDKIVISPPYFDNRYKDKTIICDNWIAIGNS